MKEDVIAANLANLRQSVNELKESVDKLSDNSSSQVQSAACGLFTTALPKVSVTVGTMPCRY